VNMHIHTLNMYVYMTWASPCTASVRASYVPAGAGWLSPPWPTASWLALRSAEACERLPAQPWPPPPVMYLRVQIYEGQLLNIDYIGTASGHVYTHIDYLLELNGCRGLGPLYLCHVRNLLAALGLRHLVCVGMSI
jgi:hypothetical protein